MLPWMVWVWNGPPHLLWEMRLLECSGMFCVQTFSLLFPEKIRSQSLWIEGKSHTIFNLHLLSCSWFNRQPRCYFEYVKPFRKKNETQKPNSCWTHWSRNGLHPFPFGMRKINGFSHPFRWRFSPYVSRGGETVKMRTGMTSPLTLVCSLGPFWIIHAEGVFCCTRKLNSLEPKWPLFWLEKAPCFGWLTFKNRGHWGSRSFKFGNVDVWGESKKDPVHLQQHCKWQQTYSFTQKNNVYIIHLDLFLDFRLLVSSISPLPCKSKPIKIIVPWNCWFQSPTTTMVFSKRLFI